MCRLPIRPAPATAIRTTLRPLSVMHEAPVDSRTTSWVGITIGVSGRLTIRPRTRSTSVRPACSTSLWTVVNDGWQKSAPKISSWPTTLIAPGTSTFLRRNRCRIPMASKSLNATRAVAPLPSPTSAAAEPWSSVGMNGPRRTISTPNRAAFSDSVRQRSASVHRAGPDKYAIERWPSAARCSTICRLPSRESVMTLANPGTSRLNSTTSARSPTARSSASGRRLEARTIPSTPRSFSRSIWASSTSGPSAMSPTTNDEPAARAWDSTPRISAALYGLPMPLTMRASKESRTGIRAEVYPRRRATSWMRSRMGRLTRSGFDSARDTVETATSASLATS